MRMKLAFAAAILTLAGVGVCYAETAQSGLQAFRRHDYGRAAAALEPLAEQGDPLAQTYLGLMYATGRGVPQDYALAAHWYRKAADCGIPLAQLMLGLMYDKGHGVPQDFILAHMWLNLAVARATPEEREYWVRLRDAVGAKLNPAQISVAQQLAAGWSVAPR
jgi:TPR repeat protein